MSWWSVSYFSKMDQIIVYEENDLMRGLLKEWLDEAGYQVSARARTGVGSQPWADLVMVSVTLPKQDGASRVREVRTVHPGARVIALSGQFRSGLRDSGATARTLGVDEVLAKPLSRTQLLDSVRGIMRGLAKPGC
jgi:DNA-binding response OmpR family regulator